VITIDRNAQCPQATEQIELEETLSECQQFRKEIESCIADGLVFYRPGDAILCDVQPEQDYIAPFSRRTMGIGRSISLRFNPTIRNFGSQCSEKPGWT
jgi:hypothetical protein